ncbi:MAG: transcription antitermination protein NusB, partial [Alphaproteobacteria bacterium]|nr:transcription antitermination protein NusB [Alphaproteobacteria bacterium]
KAVETQDDPLTPPDGALLTAILTGVEGKRGDLENIIKANNSREGRVLEPLLQAIVLCGAYELIAGLADAPIVINDYLNITHSFYEVGEVSLVNGILDSIAKIR